MTVRTAFWGDRIALHYRLAPVGGEDLMSTFDGEPVVLTLGEDEIDANLETCLVGLEPNRRYMFRLDATQAFGPPDPERVMEVPLDAFPEETLEIGSLVEFSLPGGETLAGHIRNTSPSHATVDFNHPLCGCAVEFEVKIVEIL